MTALEYCLNFRKSYIENIGQSPKEIFLTPAHVDELLKSEMLLNYLPQPTAPVKATNEVNQPGGLFTPGRTECFVEYDHHAPNYLKRLAEWETANQEFLKINPNGMILGMTIKIKGKE